MSAWLIFNRLHSIADNSHAQLLHLISLHPSFRAKVNQYYLIMNCAPSAASLNHLAALYLTFLLPDYPPKTLKQLGNELVESIRTHPNSITYNNLL